MTGDGSSTNDRFSCQTGDDSSERDYSSKLPSDQLDEETRIALRAKDLSSQWKYFQLAEFCVSHGREKEALHHAEERLT
jgi:hypothetical protein